MKTPNISVLALAVGLIFSLDAMAESMSKDQYKSLEKSIDAEFTLAKARCDSLVGNASDICIAVAKGNVSIIKAELIAKYKPSVKTRFDARIAEADANYSVAIVECDGTAGDDKGVCVKDAESVKAHEIADAITKMRTSKPDANTNEKPADASVVMEKSISRYSEKPRSM